MVIIKSNYAYSFILYVTELRHIIIDKSRLDHVAPQ